MGLTYSLFWHLDSFKGYLTTAWPIQTYPTGLLGNMQFVFSHLGNIHLKRSKPLYISMQLPSNCCKLAGTILSNNYSHWQLFNRIPPPHPQSVVSLQPWYWPSPPSQPSQSAALMLRIAPTPPPVSLQPLCWPLWTDGNIGFHKPLGSVINQILQRWSDPLVMESLQSLKESGNKIMEHESPISETPSPGKEDNF